MFKLLTFAALLSTATAASAFGRIDYKKVVDVSSATSVDDFKCIKKAGYYGILATVYTVANGGSVPDGAVDNINNANQAGLTFHDVAIEVNPTLNNKTAFDQVDEAMDALKQAGVFVQHVWVKVYGRWLSDQAKNQRFLEQVIAYLSGDYDVSGDIHSSAADFNTIIGRDSEFTVRSLWYSSTTGTGRNGASDPNFNDYQTFGFWSEPAAKEYARDITDVCALDVNLSVIDANTFKYIPEMIALSPAAKEAQKRGMIVTGTLFH